MSAATLSHPQTTSQLASLADFFFANTIFSPFSYNAEPGTRLWFASRKCIYTINDQIVALSQIIAFYLMNVPSWQTFV